MRTQVLSFKNTALFKRGVWLSAAALLAFVVAPAALTGELWRNPVPNAIKLSRASPNAKIFNLETTDCIRFLLKTASSWDIDMSLIFEATKHHDRMITHCRCRQ